MTGVYLAYPIDQMHAGRTFEVSARSWLRQKPGISWIYDPGAAFRVGMYTTRDSSIREINSEALSRAGLVVAFLPAGTVSVGVPMEIDRAVRSGIPTCVISDAPSWMLQFSDAEPGAVFPEWGSDAQEWVSEALEGISEGLSSSGRVSLPVLVSEGAEEPRRGYDDDAGLDLVVSEPRTVAPGEFVDIPCGVCVQLPEWSWGLIMGRSSTLRKRGLMVSPGVIDTGYRGPLFAGVWNLTDRDVEVEKGERVAQLILHENATIRVEVQRVDSLAPSPRGTNGFGSTGA